MAMDEKQIQEIADNVVGALQGLAPGEPNWWEPWAAFGSYAALLAAVVAFIVGARSLKFQRTALRATVKSDARNLRQKREADARSEWWRRTQWALEATRSEDEVIQDYGVAAIGVLAQSKLAGPEEKAMFDAVWQDSATELQGEEITDLVGEALDEQEETQEFTNDLVQQLRNFMRHRTLDGPAGSGDNGGQRGRNV